MMTLNNLLPKFIFFAKCGSAAKAKFEIMKYSTAEYFMFIDSDDLLLPNAGDIIKANFKNDVLTSFRFILNKKINSCTNSIITPKLQLEEKPIRYPAIICRKAYDLIGGINPQLPYCGDVDLYYRFFEYYGDACIYIDTPIMVKRLFNDSIGKKNKFNQQQTFTTIYNNYKYIYGV